MINILIIFLTLKFPPPTKGYKACSFSQNNFPCMKLMEKNSMYGQLLQAKCLREKRIFPKEKRDKMVTPTMFVYRRE